MVIGKIMYTVLRHGVSSVQFPTTRDLSLFCAAAYNLFTPAYIRQDVEVDDAFL